MNEMKIKQLESAGINYRSGVKRFLDDEELYESTLQLFLKDDLLDRAMKAYENKDYEALFDCAHEGKGSCGNLDIIVLYDLSSKIVELLRHDKKYSEELTVLYKEFVEKYQNVKKYIKFVLAGVDNETGTQK